MEKLRSRVEVTCSKPQRLVNITAIMDSSLWTPEPVLSPPPWEAAQWEAASAPFFGSPLSELLSKVELGVVLKSFCPLRLWMHEHRCTDSGITTPAKPERKENDFYSPMAAIHSPASALPCPGCHLAIQITRQLSWHHALNISLVVW